MGEDDMDGKKTGGKNSGGKGTGGVKTSQPFSDELRDASSPGTDTVPKPRPDAFDEPAKAADSAKTTQRSE